LNISKLDIGDQVTAGEVQLPAGVRVVNAPESVIAMVVNPAVEVEETVEAEEGVATDVAAPETEA
jgi:large subunit ribosomal protein L25